MGYRNFMIDIETMSTDTTNTPILQIGVVAWDPFARSERLAEFSGFKVNVYPHKNSKINFSTVQWWMKQSPEAIQSVILDDSSRASTYRALVQMNDFIQAHREPEADIKFWAMPPSFDIEILENNFRMCDAAHQIPWKYNETRCVRTVYELAGIGKDDRIKPTVAHDALEDARAQALTVNLALERLGLRK